MIFELKENGKALCSFGICEKGISVKTFFNEGRLKELEIESEKDLKRFLISRFLEYNKDIINRKYSINKIIEYLMFVRNEENLKVYKIS